MRKLTTYTLALLGMLLLFNSCKKDYESIQSIDDAKIQAYINANNLKGKMLPDPNGSGFYYQLVDQGTGAPMLNKDSVFFTLTTSSLNGKNYLSTAPFSNEGTYLGYISPSYRIALEGANRGSKVRVILPSYLAYGKNGTATIPSNEVVISEVATNVLSTQVAIDDKRISDFIASKGITATRHTSGVYYQVITAGTGTDVIDERSTLVVKYAGRLLSGTTFDSNDAATITLQGFIQGWSKVIPLFKSGAKVRLFIPSALAYGIRGNVDPVTGAVIIPPSACLDFDVTITSVTN